MLEINTSTINRNPDLGIKRAMLPAYVGISLTRWNKKLTSNIPVTPLPHPDAVPHNHTLFTDASSKGWGAVLYLDYGQMLCAGGIRVRSQQSGGEGRSSCFGALRSSL